MEGRRDSSGIRSFKWFFAVGRMREKDNTSFPLSLGQVYGLGAGTRYSVFWTREPKGVTVGRRLIVGVFGPTRKPTERSLGLAREVGNEIRRHGAILLTGGHHRYSTSRKNNLRRTAKTEAMQGALDKKSTDGVGRAIGVLRRAKETKVRVEPRQRGPHRVVYVHTRLRNARNLLNGVLCDVAIALDGGPGTLSEVGFAAMAGRPIIFLDSLKTLGRTLHGPPKKNVERIDGDARGAFEDWLCPDSSRSPLLEVVSETLHSGSAMTASTARDAVEQGVAAAIGSIAESVACYPEFHADLPPRAEFHAELDWLNEG